MAALTTVLKELDYDRHYREVILAGGAPGPFAHDYAAARARVASLPADLAPGLRLLALGEAASIPRLPAVLRESLPLLERAGLGGGAGPGTWATGGWVVAAVRGARLLADRPRSYGGGEVRAYLGPDSLLLAAGLPRQPGLSVLDLGAGCGIQGLTGTPDPTRVTLVDIEPRAVALCELNAELNGLGDRCRCLRGDLYGPVAGEAFDLIACLPPYVPIPDGLAYSGVANGGPDGLAVIRRVLAGAGAHLRPGGRLVMLCQLLAGARGPLLDHVEITTLRRRPAAELVAELATGLAARLPAWSQEALADAYRESFARMGVTAVDTALVTAYAAPPPA